MNLFNVYIKMSDQSSLKIFKNQLSNIFNELNLIDIMFFYCFHKECVYLNGACYICGKICEQSKSHKLNVWHSCVVCGYKSDFYLGKCNKCKTCNESCLISCIRCHNKICSRCINNSTPIGFDFQFCLDCNKICEQCGNIHINTCDVRYDNIMIKN